MTALSLSPAHLRTVLALLARHAHGLEVLAYGSRLGGTAHDGSDLDLVIRNPANLSVPQTQLAALREAFAESNLPILVEVFDWAQLPESFRREVQRAHVILPTPEPALPTSPS